MAPSSWQGGQALAGWSGIPASPATILVSAVILVVAIFGYRLIHAMQKWVSLLSCLAFAYLTVRLEY